MTGRTTSTSPGLRKRVNVSVDHDRMGASITISAPQSGEPPITIDEIDQALKESNVLFGVDEAAIASAYVRRNVESAASEKVGPQ